MSAVSVGGDLEYYLAEHVSLARSFMGQSSVAQRKLGCCSIGTEMAHQRHTRRDAQHTRLAQFRELDG